MRYKLLTLLSIFFFFLISCNKDEEKTSLLELHKIFIGDLEIDPNEGPINDVPLDRPITLSFSSAVDQESAKNAIILETGEEPASLTFNFGGDGKTVTFYPEGLLKSGSVYTLLISNQLKSTKGASFPSATIQFKTVVGEIRLMQATIEDRALPATGRILDVPLQLNMTFKFSTLLKKETVQNAVTVAGQGVGTININFLNDSSFVVSTNDKLPQFAAYTLALSETIEGANGETFPGYTRQFYTGKDPNTKFPIIPDEELLTLVQQQTFKYFWDFAHPASGMARERNTSGDLVTSGGSGFGLMAIIVGIERNFITRQQGVERLDKILDFLETADRFHGVWPHWINGNTGKTIAFSANDNGGDLVETSFLMQGLLTFRQYLDAGNATEKPLIDRINKLWQEVEWDWYTRGGQQVLYWHWSADKEWIMNHPIRGYNEALITYFLAAASPTHAIDASVYHEGWARNGAIKNGRQFYNITLPLGEDLGGPLFFTHYSFLGLDPRNLADRYANYWEQNVNHSLINQAYVVANPRNYVGYSDENWGLTASDNQNGYSAHSPTNDLGVITPTAALSSFPYTPEQSMKALKFFYYTMGDKLWGEYGFKDAYNLTEGWVADSYLAIDQGPIIVMIENQRTGLLWDLFMSAPEVKVAMDKLEFTN